MGQQKKSFEKLLYALLIAKTSKND